MKIIGVYLAAGNSMRTGPGMHKLSFPIQGIPLGQIALQTALSANLSELVVVANDTSWLSRAIRNTIHIVPCKQATLGQSHSLCCGIKKAEMLNADAVMILLADQPFITVQILNELIGRYQQQPNLHYVAASYQGVLRPPVVLSRKLFPALQALQGDQGARSLFGNPQWKGQVISYEEADLFTDVDTIVDYNSMQKLYYIREEK